MFPWLFAFFAVFLNRLAESAPPTSTLDQALAAKNGTGTTGGTPLHLRGHASPGLADLLAARAGSGRQLGEMCLTVAGGRSVGLSTRGATALRLRLGCGKPVSSPMISPEEPDAAWQPANSSHGEGIVSGVGSLVVSPEGVVTLMDSRGYIVTHSAVMGSLDELTFMANGGQVYGHGAAARNATVLASYGNVTPVVFNHFAEGSHSSVPHYYSTDGYAALGVSSETFVTEHGAFLSATYDAGASHITWRNVRSGPLDLYLMPAATLAAGTAAYYGLIGKARVPPRWTFGFMASRWGWRDESYINETLAHFRAGGYPADAFIMDFEFYTDEPDYLYPPEGKASCHDFSFRNVTFPDPLQQLSRYRTELHFRFGGIRKQRLCNSELLAFARSQGWLLEQGGPTGEDFSYIGRQMDFSNPALQSWYEHQLAHYIENGVSFWFNDEAESDYFAFYWMNVAQSRALRSRDPTARFYSLNRNFSPGMARLGVAVWTGDSSPTWWDLAAQPGYVLNWALAGAPYVASDIGGFSSNTTAELLVRWYQMSVFTPVMRVHCTAGEWATPHWPWLWGEEAAAAMKAAMDLRYRLIPYHYSFAHSMYLNRRLWMQPMVMAFPDESDAADLAHQWIDGELLVAPVLRNDSEKKIYLPQGRWFPFEASNEGTSAPLHGPLALSDTATFQEIPAFAPAGSIVPLAPMGLQYTDALPGGPLEVRIYSGRDASFELFEDDGVSLSYVSGVVRSTHFQWSEASRRLSWFTRGPAVGGFTDFFAVLFEADGSQTRSKTTSLASSGAIRFSGHEDLVVSS